jgi:hypothetical protein
LQADVPPTRDLSFPRPAAQTTPVFHTEPLSDDAPVMKMRSE